MPAEVRRIAKNYMENPFELTVGTKNAGNVNINHEYYVVRPRDKYAALKRLVDYTRMTTLEQIVAFELQFLEYEYTANYVIKKILQILKKINK